MPQEPILPARKPMPVSSILWGIILANVSLIVLLLLMMLISPQGSLSINANMIMFFVQVLANALLAALFFAYFLYEVGSGKYRLYPDSPKRYQNLYIALTFVLAGCLSAFLHVSGCSVILSSQL